LTAALRRLHAESLRASRAARSTPRVDGGERARLQPLCAAALQPRYTLCPHREPRATDASGRGAWGAPRRRRGCASATRRWGRRAFTPPLHIRFTGALRPLYGRLTAA
jgi:hypothetical protein